MSNRTPTLQARSQYHAYWGQYAWNAGGSDAGAANLPNDTANALPQPYFSQLEVGDTASTTDASVANRGLWVCVSTGTVGGADAQWRRLDNGATVTQVVRDAHVIVVAQSGRLTTLFGATPPPANRLNLVAVTGDSADVTCDFLDLGDGAQLALALLAAAAAGAGISVDVRLRACSIFMNQAGSPALPLTVPTRTHLLGGGRAVSAILGDNRNGNTQEIFILALGAELSDISIISPVAVTPAAGASLAVIRTSGTGVSIHDCGLALQGAVRTQPWMVWDSTGTIDIHNVAFVGADQTVATNRSTCLVVGDPTSVDSFTQPAEEWTLADSRVAGYNRIVFSYNCAAGCVDNIQATIVRPTAGAIQTLFAGAPVANPVVGIRLSNIRIIVSTTETVGDVIYYGVRILILADGFVVSGITWTGVEVLFAPLEAATIPRNAFDLAVLVDNAKLEGGTIEGCTALGHSTGARVIADAATTNGTISDIMFTGCLLKNPTAIGADPGYGMHLTATNAATVENMNVSNCNLRGAPAAGFGIDISTAAVSDTIVVANQLAPNGGTAINDAGTGTEAAHNILV